MTTKKTKPFDENLSDAEFRSRIVSALRQSSRWWKPKQEAINRAKVRRGVYKCESCGEEGPPTLPPEPGKKRRRKNIQADHFYEVVPITGFGTYDEWIKRCFVGADGFQAICWECHTKKTKKENNDRRDHKKGIEVWRNHPTYEGYKVSTKGLVMGPTGKILSQIDNGGGYYKISIGKHKKEYVHRMVAETFIGKIEGLCVCHKDDNKKNNNVSNLFIGTAQDNVDDKVKKGRHIIGGKAISQFDMKGNWIKDWEGGAGEIMRELGYSDGNIYKCCNGEYKQSKGFIWKFKE